MLPSDFHFLSLGGKGQDCREFFGKTKSRGAKGLQLEIGKPKLIVYHKLVSTDIYKSELSLRKLRENILV